MAYPALFRQEVWDIELDTIGESHPGVILSINKLNDKLSSVVVVIVTGTAGPDLTHIPLGPETGLTRYPVSYANITDVHAVDRYAFVEKRGQVTVREMSRITDQLKVYLGC